MNQKAEERCRLVLASQPSGFQPRYAIALHREYAFVEVYPDPLSLVNELAAAGA